mmetsp:Transcript_9592/g.23763  ORF Transcript_9592/g.23763 Transcript_9592/m.23763 type:complete len:260 (+) Transcript_9592:4936-5715(+)
MGPPAATRLPTTSPPHDARATYAAGLWTHGTRAYGAALRPATPSRQWLGPPTTPSPAPAAGHVHARPGAARGAPLPSSATPARVHPGERDRGRAGHQDLGLQRPAVPGAHQRPPAAAHAGRRHAAHEWAHARGAPAAHADHHRATRQRRAAAAAVRRAVRSAQGRAGRAGPAAPRQAGQRVPGRAHGLAAAQQPAWHGQPATPAVWPELVQGAGRAPSWGAAGGRYVSITVSRSLALWRRVCTCVCVVAPGAPHQGARV